MPGAAMLSEILPGLPPCMLGYPRAGHSTVHTVSPSSMRWPEIARVTLIPLSQESANHVVITFPLRRRNQHVVRASVDRFYSAGMVRVKVCQHDGMYPINAEAAQAGLCEVGMPTGVNKNVAGLPLRVESPHHQGITLSHIAHGDSPVGGTRYRKANDLGNGDREGETES